MLPLISIILASLAGVASTWVLSGGLRAGDGNPLLCTLVGLAIPLLAAQRYGLIERNLLKGRFTAVRHKLRFWASTMGREECCYTHLLMAVEERNAMLVKQAEAAAQALGHGPFAQAWGRGRLARAGGDHAVAFQEFATGAAQATGVDRAELQMEAALTLCMGALREPGTDQTSAARDALALLASAHDTLGAAEAHTDRHRARYLAALHDAVRSLVLIAQGRLEDGARRLSRSIAVTGQLTSQRGRHLSHALALEHTVTLLATEGGDAAGRALQGLSKGVGVRSFQTRTRELNDLYAAQPSRRTPAGPAAPRKVARTTSAPDGAFSLPAARAAQAAAAQTPPVAPGTPTDGGDDEFALSLD